MIYFSNMSCGVCYHLAKFKLDSTCAWRNKKDNVLKGKLSQMA
jgi:hypothetical protein